MKSVTAHFILKCKLCLVKKNPYPLASPPCGGGKKSSDKDLNGVFVHNRVSV